MSESEECARAVERQKRMDALSTAIDLIQGTEAFMDVTDTLSDMYNELVEEIIEVRRK